jgi:hypothetical protein
MWHLVVAVFGNRNVNSPHMFLATWESILSPDSMEIAIGVSWAQIIRGENFSGGAHLSRSPSDYNLKE